MVAPFSTLGNWGPGFPLLTQAALCCERQKRISVTRQFDRDGQVQEGGRGIVVGRNVIGGVVTDHPARKALFKALGPRQWYSLCCILVLSIDPGSEMSSYNSSRLEGGLLIPLTKTLA